MGSITAQGLLNNLPNYQGKFIATSQLQNPLSTLIGMGATEAGQSPFRAVNGKLFNMSQDYSLDAPSQPNVTEADSLLASTKKINATTQNVNVCQIFREGLQISEDKLTDMSMSGNAINNDLFIQNAVNKQVSIRMKQLKRDYEYSIINGVYNGNPAVSQINGIATAVVTNKIDASAGAVSKDLINNLIGAMLSNGADFDNVVLMGGINLIQKINNLYGVQLRSNKTGGINLTEIDLAVVGITKLIFNPKVGPKEILALDLGMIEGTAYTQAGFNQISVREVAQAGQGISLDLYATLGIDFGHESKHGRLYNLA